eukprot:942234-Pyramimonas_sp.AAC.1
MAPGGAAPSALRPPMSSIAFCNSPLTIKGEGSSCSLDSGGALGNEHLSEHQVHLPLVLVEALRDAKQP